MGGDDAVHKNVVAVEEKRVKKSTNKRNDEFHKHSPAVDEVGDGAIGDVFFGGR